MTEALAALHCAGRHFPIEETRLTGGRPRKTLPAIPDEVFPSPERPRGSLEAFLEIAFSASSQTDCTAPQLHITHALYPHLQSTHTPCLRFSPKPTRRRSSGPSQRLPTKSRPSPSPASMLPTRTVIDGPTPAYKAPWYYRMIWLEIPFGLNWWTSLPRTEV